MKHDAIHVVMMRLVALGIVSLNCESHAFRREDMQSHGYAQQEAPEDGVDVAAISQSPHVRSQLTAPVDSPNRLNALSKLLLAMNAPVAPAFKLGFGTHSKRRHSKQGRLRSALVLRGGDGPRRVAIVTGGTRGCGYGIATALAEDGFDLLLSYNTNAEAAEKAAAELREAHNCSVEVVGGDISLPATRDAIFAKFDDKFKPTHDLGAVVHNAGQYVGITSDNAAGLQSGPTLGFGDGSLLDEAGQFNFDVMKYYQRMYGDAYVDMCERGLARMGDSGGSLIGISSPGCSLMYNANLGYDMPGSGKCVMEYAMRLFALRCAKKGINCNVVVPGVTETDAWERLATKRGVDKDELVAGISARIAPMGSMTAKQLGDAVAFLCSPKGRFVTGLSLPVDGGVHLKS